MALNVKLRASDYATTSEIILKTSRVDKRIARDLNVIKIIKKENTIIHDFGKLEKMILLTGAHTDTNAKADETELDTAVRTWYKKSTGYTTAGGYSLEQGEAELIWDDRSIIGYFRKYDVHKNSEEEAYNYLLEFAVGYKKLQ